MKVLSRLVIAASFVFASIANANVIFSIDPATQKAHKGDSVAVTINIDDLGNFVPLSLGAFDIDVAFDPSVLSFTGYKLFDELGDLMAFDAIDSSWGEVVPGLVNVAEVSFLSNFDLWDFQPGSFALAELMFDVNMSAGGKTSPLFFTFIDITDTNGDPINIRGVFDASITVPTPTPLTLMGLALLAMFVKQKYYPLGAKKA